MASTAPPTIRLARNEDDGAILEAFRRVYGPLGGGQCSPREWRWRYGEQPLGRRSMIAVDGKGRVLAHYGARAQRALVEGRWTVFLQAVDSFCEPRARGGLARAGLFARVGRAFEEAFVGPPHGAADGGPELDVERAPFIWGLPVLPAWRSGRSNLGYGHMRQLLLLVAEVEPAGPGERAGSPVAADARLEIRQLPPGEALPASCDSLSRTLLLGTRAGVLRDRAWLEWRYRARPGVDYDIALVERTGDLLGLAVARVCSALAPAPPGQSSSREPGDAAPGLVICEWCVPAGDAARGVRGALLKWARERARVAGVGELRLHLGERSPEFTALQGAGFSVRATGRTVAAHSCLARRDLVWFADHLEVSLGDTDLV